MNLDAQLNLDFTKPVFDGSDIIDEKDTVRLTGQMKRIFKFMFDGRWHTLPEISEVTGDMTSSISAQLRNLRKSKFGSHTIEKQSKGDRENGLFKYQLIPNSQVKLDLL